MKKIVLLLAVLLMGLLTGNSSAAPVEELSRIDIPGLDDLFRYTVDDDSPAVVVPMLEGQPVDLKVKTEIGQKIWIFLQAPSLVPDLRFARVSDAYAAQNGSYVVLFSANGNLLPHAAELYYTAVSEAAKIDFGSNNFSGVGNLFITVKKGESPENPEMVQAILLLPISEQQQLNIAKLAADLQSIRSGSEITEEQKQQLAEDLQALIEGSVKPSTESLEKLVDDLSAAFSDGQIPVSEQLKLVNDMLAVLNSANIPAEEMEAVIQDIQEIVSAGGVTEEEAQMIADDLRAIVTEIQNGGSDGTPFPPLPPGFFS